MARKEIDAGINVPEDADTTPPEGESTPCVYCYISGNKYSPGSIANFAGQRRECVIENGVGKWRNYNLSQREESLAEEENEFNCPNCFFDDTPHSEGTILNFAGQRRECVVIRGQGKWKDF